MPTTAMSPAAAADASPRGESAWTAGAAAPSDSCRMCAAISDTVRCSNSRVPGSCGNRSISATVISTILNESQPSASRLSIRFTSAAVTLSARAKASNTNSTSSGASRGATFGAGVPSIADMSRRESLSSQAARLICASRVRIASSSQAAVRFVPSPSATASGAWSGGSKAIAPAAAAVSSSSSAAPSSRDVPAGAMA